MILILQEQDKEHSYPKSNSQSPFSKLFYIARNQSILNIHPHPLKYLKVLNFYTLIPYYANTQELILFVQYCFLYPFRFSQLCFGLPSFNFHLNMAYLLIFLFKNQKFFNFFQLLFFSNASIILHLLSILIIYLNLLINWEIIKILYLFFST